MRPATSTLAALAAFARLGSLTMHRLSFHGDAGAAATPPAPGTPAPAAAAAAAPPSTEGQKPEEKPGEAKPGEAAAPPEKKDPPAPATGAPATYTLKLPDGSKLDADLVNRTAATARALGLSNEAGQKMLDAAVAEIDKATTAAIDAAKAEQLAAMKPGGAIWTEQVVKWGADALADAEIGGTPEKLQATVTLAKRVIDRFASDETKKFFSDSEFGSHPELVRIFSRIGKVMSEATLAAPGPKGTGTEKKSFGEKLYTTMAAN